MTDRTIENALQAVNYTQ